MLNFQHDDSRIRTPAEVAAVVTPVNYAYPPLNLRRYGGAPGADDNSAAMEAALAVCAAQDGGTIYLDTPGEWRMNVVVTTNSVTIEGPDCGLAEFDVACIRPASLTSAPITFGNGIVELRYCRLRNVHMSGTDDPGGAHYNETAHSAPQCLKLHGVISFRSDNCVFYNGVHTIHIEPSATVPVTDIRFNDTKARNDIADDANARLIYGLRLDESLGGGYYTDVLFIGFKGNGPKSGYFAEFDGTIAGLQGRFIGGYADISPGHGVLLKGAAGFYPSDDFDLDPATTGAVIIETDQAQADPTRFIFGQMGHGGQKMKFFGGATIDIPAEADWFFYRARLYRAFLGQTNYVSTSNDPYNTSISWDLSSAAGPLSLTGAQLLLNSGLRLAGSDVVQEFYESDQGTNSKLWWTRVNTSNWTLQSRNDDGSAGKVFIAASRSGTTLTGIELGNATDLAPNTLNGHLRITDGVAAPSTVSGYAAIYVDSADGDLKVKFGDGTVKTIVVDT